MTPSPAASSFVSAGDGGRRRYRIGEDSEKNTCSSEAPRMPIERKPLPGEKNKDSSAPTKGNARRLSHAHSGAPLQAYGWTKLTAPGGEAL